MMCCDALVKAISIIIRVLLRIGFSAELRDTPTHFAAIPNGRPMAPVKTLTHTKVWGELVVNTELDGPCIQKPCLVTGGVTGDVVDESRSIWFHHESGNP